jgi:hypothetical protein
LLQCICVVVYLFGPCQVDALDAPQLPRDVGLGDGPVENTDEQGSMDDIEVEGADGHLGPWGASSPPTIALAWSVSDCQ